jgi:hopanoid biosynthesis associated protein HpnK
MAARRLIINADDFGLTDGVNRAIAEAHSRGVVTSATLMATGAAFDGAVAVAKQNSKLSVGCHVLLVDGVPAAKAADLPTLVKENQFQSSLLKFVQAAVRGRLNPQEIAAEVAAQIRKLQQAGISVSQVDTHKHTHMFPAVLRPLLEAARQCGVRAVRNPFAPLKPLAWAHLARRPRLWTRYTEVRALRGFAASFRRAVAEMGMLTTDGSFGVLSTGALDEKLFTSICGCIPEGTWEFVCHPGYNDAALSGVRTRLRASRELELKVLTSPEAKEALQRHGIELISYRELAES